ncbi:nitroreductase Nfs [Pelomyxa schiedti]|nr:nitroreductase Nfs [Pelomyxa schiedti]
MSDSTSSTSHNSDAPTTTSSTDPSTSPTPTPSATSTATASAAATTTASESSESAAPPAPKSDDGAESMKHLDDVETAIKNRRSVRSFNSRLPIEPEKVSDLQARATAASARPGPVFGSKLGVHVLDKVESGSWWPQGSGSSVWIVGTAPKEWSCISTAAIPSPSPASTSTASGSSATETTATPTPTEASGSGSTSTSTTSSSSASSPTSGSVATGLQTVETLRFDEGLLLKWMAPGSPKDPRGLIDLGFVFEDLVIRAAQMDLGTVWLAGTFNRDHWTKVVNLPATEFIPAVSPVGYHFSNTGGFFGKKELKKLPLSSISATSRFQWSTLFFYQTFSTPLTREKAGPYEACFEAVRVGPSSRNTQAWRIVYTGTEFHFFYTDANFMTSLDAGIGLCHWSLMCEARGLHGAFTGAGPAPNVNQPQGVVYITTWRPSA